MELRWLEGDWSFGKWKLQMKASNLTNDWVDVPMAKANPVRDLELWEKIHAYLRKLPVPASTTAAYDLAKIAEAHFKESNE